MRPCKFDHNGECLICDCFISYCAWDRYLRQDYQYESKEELEKLFENEPKDNSESPLLGKTSEDTESNI
jgi:hypothetical protein